MAHALSPEPLLGVPLDRLPVEADPAWLEAESKLAEFTLGTSLDGRPAKMLLERGDVWDVISDIIQKNKIDLVVTATHGRQGLKKLVMGSAAEKIYRGATCPVLTIGPQVPPLKDREMESQDHPVSYRRLRNLSEGPSLCIVPGRREPGHSHLLTGNASGLSRGPGIGRGQRSGGAARFSTCRSRRLVQT